MAKYLLSIVEDETVYAPAGSADFDALLAAHTDFAASITEAGGELIGGEALQPSSTATYLRNTRTAAVTTVDNPLPEVKEILGGFYLIEAADDAKALEIAKLCPAPNGYVEIRPIWNFG